MKKIIAISGKAGAGKSTLAKLLTRCLSNSEIMSFADSLKQEVNEHYNISLNDLYDVEKKKAHRKTMQEHGDCRRKENPDYWCERLKNKIDRPEKDIIIIDDLRFLNEVTFLKKNFDNVFLVRVEHYEDSQHDRHLSETELDNQGFWDFRMKPEKGELSLMAEQISRMFNSSDETEHNFRLFEKPRKGLKCQLMFPQDNNFNVSNTIYKVHKTKLDGTVILKPIRKVKP